jgi:hypothetical protein
LSVWWHKVFGEPPPLEHGALSGEVERAELAPDRQALIDELTRRQHDQANEITAETGQAYVTSRRDAQAEADGIALRRERLFWERHGGHHPGRHHRG